MARRAGDQTQPEGPIDVLIRRLGSQPDTRLSRARQLCRQAQGRVGADYLRLIEVEVAELPCLQNDSRASNGLGLHAPLSRTFNPQGLAAPVEHQAVVGVKSRSIP